MSRRAVTLAVLLIFIILMLIGKAFGQAYQNYTLLSYCEVLTDRKDSCYDIHGMMNASEYDLQIPFSGDSTIAFKVLKKFRLNHKEIYHLKETWCEGYFLVEVTGFNADLTRRYYSGTLALSTVAGEYIARISFYD